MKQIVVIAAGHVVIGDVTPEKDRTIIKNASFIRTWGTTKGLGQIALEGPTTNTILDYAGTITVLNHAVYFHIDCVV